MRLASLGIELRRGSLSVGEKGASVLAPTLLLAMLDVRDALVRACLARPCLAGVVGADVEAASGTGAVPFTPLPPSGWR